MDIQPSALLRTHSNPSSTQCKIWYAPVLSKGQASNTNNENTVFYWGKKKKVCEKCSISVCCIHLLGYARGASFEVMSILITPLIHACLNLSAMPLSDGVKGWITMQERKLSVLWEDAHSHYHCYPM